jgi:hypothetical protein
MSQKLLIKFPTRQRPEKFFNTLDLYIKLLDNPEHTHFFIVMDEDDRSMNNNDVKTRLARRKNLSYVYGNAKNKIEAVNWPVPESFDKGYSEFPFDDETCWKWDILLLASDDMIPQVQGYDTVIREEMVKHFPDMDGVLWFNDGYRKDVLNTLCIFGHKYFDRFGYIYNPIYVTWYADDEFMHVANLLNRQKYYERVIISHEHPDNGVGSYDDLYRKNAIGGVDKPAYVGRHAHNFFIKKVLIIQPGRYGDIIICLPIAKWLHEQNCVVEWLCPAEYHEMFRNIDYAVPVLASGANYHQIIDLSFGFGGILGRWWNDKKHLFDSFVTAKYYLAGLSLAHRWNLCWKRNETREMALYYLITEKHGKDYILVHEESHCGKYIDHPDKNKVVFKPTDNFNIFDWYEVIKQAREIHCIDSVLSNFIEVVPEFKGKEKVIYLSAREPNKYLRSIYRNGWTIV